MEDIGFLKNNVYIYNLCKDSSFRCFEMIEKEKAKMFNKKILTFDEVKKYKDTKILIWNSSKKLDFNYIIRDSTINYCFEISESKFKKSCYICEKRRFPIEDRKEIEELKNYLNGEYEIIISNYLPFNLKYEIFSLSPNKSIFFFK